MPPRQPRAAPRVGGAAQLQALQRAILTLGFVRPGSLVRRYMPCGNAACRCMARPPQLHGPYYQWTYKVAGRTKTMRLSEEQAQLCREWLRNHKQLKRLVRQMEQLSLRETNRVLGAISRQ
jgi:hypothetical protein